MKIAKMKGDLILAAELATPEHVNFMLRNGRGVLCAPITIERCNQLGLEHQVQTNTSMLGTPFTVTVDLLEGCTTGVSCHDRAATIRALANPDSRPETFRSPWSHQSALCTRSWRLGACRTHRSSPLTWLVWQVCNPLLA